MATGWDGAGNFTRGDGTREGATTWSQAKVAGALVDAPDHDTHDEILAVGIEACLAKNGENAMTGDFNMGSQDINSCGDINMTGNFINANAGTGNAMYVNKASASGNFIDFWLNGIASVFSVDFGGNIDATVVTCNGVVISTLDIADGTAPASSADTGTAGEVRYVGDDMYRCTATNTWVKFTGVAF